tara:strand:- start:407 stop:1192 length:786 start_codon:yes stop_codon:yes gene_type:complete
MDNIKEELLKELLRFKEIGRNSDNLTEQLIGGGSGFVDDQGQSNTLTKFSSRQKEMVEQDIDLDAPEAIPTDPEEEMGDMETEEIPMDLEDEEVDTGTEEEIDINIDDTAPEDSTELDITDLVTKQDEVNAEIEGQKDILSKNTESLDDLMTKLSELENHLTSMDGMMAKIDNLEDKLEEYRPRTPQEQQQTRRKYDSGPFSNSLSDFFNDKEEGFVESGKKQYILTKDDVENYSDADIKKSFADPEEEEEPARNDYRGIK